MIFAREPSPELATLIKKIDAVTKKNKGHEMGSFVVFSTTRKASSRN